MKHHIEIETLEALLLETLPAAQTAETSAHVASCEECQDEIKWLRAERELMARRSQPKLSVNAWPHVQAGIDRAAQRWQLGRWFAFGGSGLLAVACVMLLLTGEHDPARGTSRIAAGGQKPEFVDPKDPQVVLAQAEREYDAALDTLATEYQDKRKQWGAGLPPEFDEELSAVRKNLAKARREAGDDVGARVAVLDAYSGYLHAMQDTVLGIEEGQR